MARARSESIFCWPRTRDDFFRRECFFDEAEAFVVAVRLCVAGFAVAVFAELSCAPAIEISEQPNASVQMTPNRAFRIGIRSINIGVDPGTSPSQKKMPNLLAGTVIMLHL